MSIMATFDASILFRTPPNKLLAVLESQDKGSIDKQYNRWKKVIDALGRRLHSTRAVFPPILQRF